MLTAIEVLAAIETHLLKVNPVLSRDGVTWSVGKRSLRRDGANLEIHRILDAPTVSDGVAEWLRYYGPEPSHGIKVGSVVAHRRLTDEGSCGFGVVLRVGNWGAIVAYRDRVPAMAPLACLRVVDVTVGWTPEPDDGSEDCNDPDYFCV